MSEESTSYVPEFMTSVLSDKVPEIVKVPADIVVSPEYVLTPDKIKVPDPVLIKLEDPAIIPP